MTPTPKEERKTAIIPFRYDPAKKVYVIEIANDAELWARFQRLLIKGGDAENLNISMEPYNA